MNKKKAEKGSGRAANAHWVRASISFQPDLYGTLQGLARQKKVSLAWVVRDAAERYVVDEKSRSANRE